MNVKKSFLPLVLVASLLQALLLTGCGGNSSPTGVANSGEVQLRLTGAGVVSSRSALGAARSVEVAGATVLVDGVPAGVTDSSGEITLQLEAGTHSITITSGGVTSSTLSVTISEGEVLKLEVEMKADGTLDVEQDIDHDGDVDEEDDDDGDIDDDDDGDVDDEDDDDKVDSGTKP